MRDLFTDYIAEAPQLAPFYGRSIRDLFDSAPKAAPWDPPLAKDLRNYQENLGGHARFMGDEAVVVTGQQAGLLTGPLYTIYKAATAIRLARKLRERFGTACIPLFWVASDDHDFEEARTAYVLTKAHEALPLRYEPRANVNALPMHRVPLEDSLHDIIDAAATQTRGSEHRERVAAFLHESLEKSASLADWTARILARLFRDTPLVLFAPHLTSARKLAAPVFEHEITHPLESTMLLNEAGKRLRELDYAPQIEKGAIECGFFIEMGGRRRKVLFDKERYVIPTEGIACTTSEMVAMLHAAPDRFSANAALRCVVQQRLFPVAAYVGGPGELAYWGQLRQVFAVFGEEMPAVYPRARALLTTAKLNQLRGKFGFSPSSLAAGPEALMEQAYAANAAPDGRVMVGRHRPAIEAALAPLVAEAAEVSATAAAMSANLSRRLGRELDRLERTIMRGTEDQAAAVRQQVARLCTSLCPNRKPQERVYNVLSFLFEHGWDLVPRLIEELDIDSFETKEITL
ncbi:MAG: bacillithiol biosynthesis cysteine-adding enzyme BshC [Nitrospiraceae bacterium]|nr:bacillithiol biosynthesis cysteine-adding enzyme BshC [Nitrospiraceae bacterium]